MSDMHMIDNEAQRDDRKEQAEMLEKKEFKTPNRKTRRMIAKQRGVFKHPGAWPYINQRSTNQTNQALNGDQNDDTQE